MEQVIIHVSEEHLCCVQSLLGLCRRYRCFFLFHGRWSLPANFTWCHGCSILEHSSRLPRCQRSVRRPTFWDFILTVYFRSFFFLPGTTSEVDAKLLDGCKSI